MFDGEEPTILHYVKKKSALRAVTQQGERCYSMPCDLHSHQQVYRVLADYVCISFSDN